MVLKQDSLSVYLHNLLRKTLCYRFDSHLRSLIIVHKDIYIYIYIYMPQDVISISVCDAFIVSHRERNALTCFDEKF